jgi:hypothetical protein
MAHAHPPWPDGKTLHVAAGRGDLLRDFPDVIGHAAGEGFHEGIDLGRLAFDDGFHGPIAAVSHVAADGKLLGQLPGGVAEAHALDHSGKDDHSPLQIQTKSPWPACRQFHYTRRLGGRKANWTAGPV